MDKLQIAKQEKADSGWFPGTQVPLGYIIKKRKGKAVRWSEVIPDPDKNKVRQVQLEFELRAQGLSYPSIHKTIIAYGFVPHEKMLGYHFSSIEKRIKNPFYAGRFRWKGKEYNGRHELIVPAHIFKAAQRGSRKPSSTKCFRISSLHCADCGSVISFETKKYITSVGEERIFYYYRCTNRSGFHASMKGLFVPENILLQQIDSLIGKIGLKSELAQKIADALNDSRQSFLEIQKSALLAIDCQMTALDRLEDDSLKKMISGELSNARFSETRLEARNLRHRLTKKSLLHRREILLSRPESKASVLGLAEQLKELFLSQNAEDKISLIHLIYENVRLRGRRLEADLKSPFLELMQLQNH